MTEVRRRRTDGMATRIRVLDAVVASILEKGYYRTSSNEIARRAGVTWGALQHQFGSRELLLLEVLNERWHDLQHAVATAEVRGDTLEARLRGVLDVLATHYEQPAQLAALQILLDLSRDPDVSAATKDAVAEHGERLTRAWQPLFKQALGDAAADATLVKFAFVTLRGYLTGNLVASHIAHTGDDRKVREMLVRGVACAIRERAAERGLSLPGNTNG
ncbi:MAG: TetR/AcrR family transcriptional regulator [Actinobacteria bacterium]|nr:TetR/AcrR family transcriptional regulator [Actinomycetota bacterium]